MQVMAMPQQTESFALLKQHFSEREQNNDRHDTDKWFSYVQQPRWEKKNKINSYQREQEQNNDYMAS